MSKQMEFHLYCQIFPQGSEQVINDLANDIKTHGLVEKIITFEDKILDGRNRYLACLKAGVDPVFEEYDGDNPLQYVVSKNLHRRHLDVGQRAMIANDVWKKAKENGVPKATLDYYAKQFAVSERSIRDAGTVKESASEAVQKAVREGSTSLSKVAAAVKEARKKTGVTVKPDTSPEEKKQAHEAQERILNGEPLHLLPTKPPKTPEQAFSDRVTSGEFNGKRWQRNIAEMQTIIAAVERLPALYHDNFDLLKSLTDTAMLNTMCGMYIETVQKVKTRLQRNEEPDFSDVKKIFTDLAANKFPSIDNDFGAGDKKELCEDVKNRIICECDKTVEAVEAVRKKLMPIPRS
jgi:hypothetical protein